MIFIALAAVIVGVICAIDIDAGLRDIAAAIRELTLFLKEPSE